MRHSPIPRALGAAVLLVVIGLDAGACGGAAPGSTSDPTPSSAGAAALDTRPFVECMRAHGLPDFPDVSVSSDGLVNFDIRGERVDADSELYGAAVQACQSLLPDGARLPDAPAAPPAPEAPTR